MALDQKALADALFDVFAAMEDGSKDDAFFAEGVAKAVTDWWNTGDAVVDPYITAPPATLSGAKSEGNPAAPASTVNDPILAACKAMADAAGDTLVITQKIIPAGRNGRPAPLFGNTGINAPTAGAGKVDRIIVHWIGVVHFPSTPTAIYNYWAGSTTNVGSAHYVVKDSTVFQCVPLNEIAYHSGPQNPGGGLPGDFRNHYSIGIEVCPDTREGEFSEKSIKTLRKLVAKIRETYPKASIIERHFDGQPIHPIDGTRNKKDCPRYYTPYTTAGTDGKIVDGKYVANPGRTEGRVENPEGGEKRWSVLRDYLDDKTQEAASAAAGGDGNEKLAEAIAQGCQDMAEYPMTHPISPGATVTIPPASPAPWAGTAAITVTAAATFLDTLQPKFKDIFDQMKDITENGNRFMADKMAEEIGNLLIGTAIAGAAATAPPGAGTGDIT